MIRVGRLIKSFTYAFRGLVKIFREEQNLQIQSAVGLAVVVLGLIVKLNVIEWSIIILVIGSVILMEIANSALERVTDILKPRIHDYVKEIKDIMAAAVMVSSLASIVIGLLIFWPHLFG